MQNLSHRFTLFSIASGLALLALFAERNLAFAAIGGGMPWALPVGLGVCLLFFPSSPLLFVAYWATHVYYLFFGFPANNTNQTLTFFVGLGIFFPAMALLLRRKSEPFTSSSLYESFAPVVRLCVIGLYFWTIFHKLNFDFITPDVSCAAQLADNMFRRNGLGELPHSLAFPAIGATLAMEGLLPLGLCFKSTQRWTAFAGLWFHWALGLAGFLGFSVTMMAVLTLFLSDSDVRHFRPKQKPFTIAVLVGLVLAVLAVKFTGLSSRVLLRYVFLAAPAIAGLIWWSNRQVAVSAGPAPIPIWKLLASPRPAYVVPVVLFLNGASPFVGFKTEYSYAMYSNLRTEGGATNHLIWRTPLRLASYQTDLVQVLEGSDPVLMKKLGGRLVTRYELTSLLWTLHHNAHRTDIQLVLDVDGEWQAYPAAERVPELMVEPSAFESRLLSFRRIEPASAEGCSH